MTKLFRLKKAAIRAAFSCFIFCLLASTDALATIYTFTGNGDWDVPGNWDANGIPLSPLLDGDAIIIASYCELNSDFTLNTGSSLTVNSGQYFFLVGRTLDNYGTITINGYINITSVLGTTFNNNSNGEVNINGDMDIDGVFDNAGLFTVNGSCNFYSELSFTNTGTIQINSGVSFRLYNPTQTFNNNNSGLIDINSGGTFFNQANFINNGTVKLDGNFINGDVDNGPGTFNNNGTLKGNGNFEQTVGNFTNSSNGIIAPGASPGKLTVSGDFDLGSGTYTAEINGPDQGTDYDWIDVSGTATIGGSSKLNIVFDYTPTVGTTFDILTASSVSGSFTYPTNVTFNGGDVATISVTYPGGNTVRVEVLSLVAGPTTYTFTGDGNWDVPGNWDANGIPPSTLTSGDSIIINPSGFCQLTSDIIIEAGSTLTVNPSKDFRVGIWDITNSGTFNMLGDINSYGGFMLINNSTGLINKNGTIFVNGSLNNAGTIIDSGGTWFITGTGATNTGTIQLNSSSQINIYPGRIFNNNGLLEVNSPTSVNNRGTFINNETLKIIGTFKNGNEDDSGIFTNNGTVQINGTFSNGDMYNPSPFTNNGILKGTGTLEQNGTFTNNSSGIIAPGLSPGKLTVSGNFNFGSGTYIAEINGPGQGTDYDWIAVSGTATIGPDSKLHIVFGNGYTPTVGTTFDILTASTVSGTFEPGNITISGGGVGTMSVTYVGGNMMRMEVASLLPVELVSFKAKEQHNKVLLNWATASEQNNRGFEVQRSGDGKTWDVLGFLAGSGTATDSHHYVYIDEKPLSGVNYYRLRQMDFDDKAEYSPTVSVKIKRASEGISLYPNPAKGDVTLSIEPGYEGEANLIIYDAMGEQIRTLSLILDSSASYSNIGLAGLPSGVYLLELQVGNERWQERLVVE